MQRRTTRRLTGRGFSFIEILIVVTIMAILASIVIPYYRGSSSAAKASALLTDLQLIRQKIQFYHVEHGGRYPQLAQMWSALIGETDVNGDPGTGFGPYLYSAPVNQFTQGTACASDNSADWQYDESTGSLRAVVPAELITELDLSPLDVVAAP